MRPGNVIERDGKLWVVLNTRTTKPGKGGAFIAIEQKELRSGIKTTISYRTQESIERAYLEEQNYSFLYQEGENYTFMNQETYDQVELNASMIGEDQARFLQDGMEVMMTVFDGAPISVSLPKQVAMTIAEADPVVKGQTAASSYKPAVLENGTRISVPPFIDAGERVIVNTEDASYVSREKV